MDKHLSLKKITTYCCQYLAIYFFVLHGLDQKMSQADMIQTDFLLTWSMSSCTALEGSCAHDSGVGFPAAVGVYDVAEAVIKSWSGLKDWVRSLSQSGHISAMGGNLASMPVLAALFRPDAGWAPCHSKISLNNQENYNVPFPDTVPLQYIFKDTIYSVYNGLSPHQHNRWLSLWQDLFSNQVCWSHNWP